MGRTPARYTSFPIFSYYTISESDLQRLKKRKTDKNQNSRPSARGKTQAKNHAAAARYMKKFELPLWSDTFFIFCTAFLLFFCIFRFYAQALWAAVLFALFAAAALAFLCHILLKKRRNKRCAARKDREERQKLSFHLALDTPEHNLSRIAAALARKTGEDAKMGKESISTPEGEYFLRFSLEPTTADELVPVVRAQGQDKTVLSNSFTKDAEKLADAFGIGRMDADEVYLLLKETDNLPEQYIMGSRMKKSLKNGLLRRLGKKSARGYLLAGVSLLLFSLISIFPVYYIVAGGLMLAAAVLVRIFGKA